jgi:hypothetical protein
MHIIHYQPVSDGLFSPRTIMGKTAFAIHISKQEPANSEAPL